MGCHWQEGSVILPINSPGVSATTTTTAIATKGKMNAIVEAVASGILFIVQPAYPHPVRYTCSYPGRGRTSTEAMKEKNASRLPPELYSIIAYHLHRTTTLLNSCSLVSSAWLVASRKYTFRTVKLTYTNVFEFLKLVEDSRCSFKCWVRRLEMREGEYVVDRWINDVLPRLVRGGGGMQSVEVLEVYNLTWAELSPGAVTALTEGFAFPSERGKITTTMKSLRVGTCYWECVHDFFGFVGSPSFAGLRTLVCDSVLLNCGMGSCRCFDVEEDLAGTAVSRNGNPNGSRESPGVKLPLALENLYLGSPEEKMVRWLIKEDAASRLEKLGLVVRERTLMNLIGQLLGRATEVKELALDFPDGCTLSLVNNTHLRSLRVYVDLSSLHSNSSRHTLSWLLDLISSINSPHIHLLILHLDLTVFSIEDFRSLWPWQDFINVINGLESMRRVVFVVTYWRRSVFNALKEVIRDVALDGFHAIGCIVKVRGVKYSCPDRRDSGSEVWKSWMEE